MKKIAIAILATLVIAASLLSSCGSRISTTTGTSTYSQAPYTTTGVPTSTHPGYTTMTPKPTSTPAHPTYTATATQTATAGHPTYPATTTWSTVAPTTSPGGTIGLSAGGAKDVSNFRENIYNNYLPLPTDVTYEGLFYDYFFDTGATEPANKLYSPSYSTAVSRDPLSHQPDYYLSVGLNSGLKAADFERKKLNLVIVLDGSGSMNSQYDQYYYDGYGNRIDTYAEEGINRPLKIDSAKLAVSSILDQLNRDDRIAIVTFNTDAYLNKPMGPVSHTNMDDLKYRVMDIAAGGSTNLAAGIEKGTQQFNAFYEIDNYEYENRMMILTDAEPNTGDFSGGGLFNLLANNANNRIYTTFIGIGVDFNSSLIEQITKVKGANYYSVHSPRQFRDRVQDEFDYMVTPLVFNVNLSIYSKGWRIEKVFGNPEADMTTGNLMHINTLFAAKSEGGENKGGIVVLKMQKISSGNLPIYLRTTYEDRNGRTDGDEQIVSLETVQPEYFDNSGIRKAVLLSRYAALLKNWLTDERQHVNYHQSWDPCIREDTGIALPLETSQWERQSLPLNVTPGYRQIFGNFSSYFAGEMDALGDRSLGQELDILHLLSFH
jgi:Ca-activated chloride channel homolog